MPTALAPIVNKRYTATFVGGPDSGRTRRECWYTETADGEWAIERVEDTGTSWLIVHLPTGTPVSSAGSLRKARLSIAAGWATCDLGRRLEPELHILFRLLAQTEGGPS